MFHSVLICGYGSPIRKKLSRSQKRKLKKSLEVRPQNPNSKEFFESLKTHIINANSTKKKKPFLTLETLDVLGSYIGFYYTFARVLNC